jgi:hypothetical protein
MDHEAVPPIRKRSRQLNAATGRHVGGDRTALHTVGQVDRMAGVRFRKISRPRVE